ncbi:MAG: tetratricopeptide repeat protein [Clostridia bacterium]|nr:tetratricopeptide repeat protein [Clostridia bacterium]
MEKLRTVQYYKNMLQEEPLNSNIMSMLAFSYMEQLDYETALYWFKKAVKATPNVQNLNNLGWYLLEEYGASNENSQLKLNDRIRYALETLEYAIKLNNQEYEQPYFGLALACYELDEKDRALKNIKKAIKIKGDYFNQNLLAVILFETGKIEEATNNFLSAYQSQPEGYRIYEAYYWYGLCLKRLGKDEEACQVAINVMKNEELMGYITENEDGYKYNVQDKPEIAVSCHFINCPICT